LNLRPTGYEPAALTTELHPQGLRGIIAYFSLLDYNVITMIIAGITKLAVRLWRRYGTMNNIVITGALLVAAGWAWGSVTTMQRNFALQREVDAKRRELELTDLEVQTLKYQQNYYKSDEYKDLAAREHLGLASPGEKVLLLPPNSEAVRRADAQAARVVQIPAGATLAASNFDQWMNFLSGASARDLQD
jgi:cell division protein FtsB